jgi:NADH dehydrogenase [ubiquinone] 1 alpha subcomplex assembly factor 7
LLRSAPLECKPRRAEAAKNLSRCAGEVEARSDEGEGPAATAEPEIRELCEPARTFIATLAARCVTHPGAALFLDYGPDHTTPGDSLQAIANGRPADPLSPPGSADLTAHVDFAMLAATARAAGATVFGPMPQGPFLARLGLFQRTGRLARGQPPQRAAALVEAAQRLAEPNRMGRLFKALALCHPACPSPPGFAP